MKIMYCQKLQNHIFGNSLIFGRLQNLENRLKNEFINLEVLNIKYSKHFILVILRIFNIKNWPYNFSSKYLIYPIIFFLRSLLYLTLEKMRVVCLLKFWKLSDTSLTLYSNLSVIKILWYQTVHIMKNEYLLIFTVYRNF